MSFYKIDFILLEEEDDEDDEDAVHTHKHYRRIKQYGTHGVHVIGRHQSHGDQSDEMEDYSGVQDFSDNDLEDEADEEEEDDEDDEEDMEEEECHEDDNISSTLEDEEDPRLCSPLTDSEDKSSPSPKQTKSSATKIHTTGFGPSFNKALVAKDIKYKSKDNSPDKPGGETTTTNKIRNHDEKFTMGSLATTQISKSQESPDRPASKLGVHQMSTDPGRAKSLPPDTFGIKKSMNKNCKKSNPKGRKRKSRPSSSSSLLEGNSEREKTSRGDVNRKETVERLRFKKKRTCTPSPPQIKGDNKESIKQNSNTKEEISRSSTIETTASLNKGGCDIKKIPSSQVDTIAAPGTSSNMKNTSPSLDARNVWWANAAAQTAAVSGRDTTIGDQSSAGSGSIFSPEISIAQWSNRGCPSPSQSGSNANVQATALAAAAVASNSTITPPPPGPSTAMAELANLVNALPRAGVGATGETVHDMRPFLRNLAAQQRWTSVEDTPGSVGNNVTCGLSDDNDSGIFR